MNHFIDAGYPYEFAGLVYYIFFLVMIRRRAGPRYSQRSRVLTIAAAIALVGAVPFHYAANAAGVGIMVALGVAALISAFVDARANAP